MAIPKKVLHYPNMFNNIFDVEALEDSVGSNNNQGKNTTSMRGSN